MMRWNVVIVGWVVTGCSMGRPGIELPPRADSPIRLVVAEPVITAPGVGQPCRGTFVIRNDGPEYEVSPHRIGPSYGVFIYDRRGALLFRNFGSWGVNSSSGKLIGIPPGGQVALRWDTRRNHLGETSEPPFVIPAAGEYELVIVVYPAGRDTMLDALATRFVVR